MKCPYCGSEMIHGYLNCGMTLWSERKHRVSLLPDGKERYALRQGSPMFSPHHVDSDFCPECKKIIMDASGYESNIE